MSPATSSRWCPTPEQLMILEELYRRGIKTPNASQIQRITAHLSLYGNIEGKNVFYWFQNHKARDRQKLKRNLIKQQQLQYQLYHPDLHYLQQNQSNHHYPILNYFDPPPPPPHTSSPLYSLSYHKSPAFPPQEGLEGAPAQMMMNHPWKVDIPFISSIRPLETLELFPITATNFKEECKDNNKISPKLISTDHFLSL